MTNDEVTRIALVTGFALKEQPDGSMALNPYVFDFARKLLSAAPTPPEVEPVAYGAKVYGTTKWAYIWHEKDDVQGWINLQHQSQDNITYSGPIPLYTSPPSPKVDEVDLLKSEIEFLTMGFNAAHATCEDLKAELAKIGKPEWDAEGNPLNLEAAARDAYTQMSICGALGEDDYEKALTNLRKFSGES
jgi:hypothetical protein